MSEAVEVRKQVNGYLVSAFAYSQAEAQHLTNILLNAKPPEAFIPEPQVAPDLPQATIALVERLDTAEAE